MSITENLKQNGKALLIVDMANSLIFPEIKMATSQQEMWDLVHKAEKERIYFHGTSLSNLRQAFAYPLLKDATNGFGFHDPWKWELGEKTFLVYGFSWEKVAELT